MDKLSAVLLGAVVALGTWLFLLPWDLSEVGSDGRLLEQGGDDYVGRIALVAGVVIVIAIGLLMAPPTRWSAAWFGVGGLATWAMLFAWRAGVSKTSGANMFMIPLLFAVIPLTVAVPLVLQRVACRLEKRS